MDTLNNIYLVLIGTRAKALYWNCFYIGAIGLVNLFLENVANLGLPVWAIGITGLVLSQISKGIKNASEGKPMGFIDK